MSYNPYNLEIKILFNESLPMINSYVENFVNRKLQAWVDQLPEVFYNEMNGFDFDVDYSGTYSDFIEIKKVFLGKGISSKDVRFFHKNKLEEISKKDARIKYLTSWLKTNTNKRLDLTFLEDNGELFDTNYSILNIFGNEDDFLVENYVVNIENINNTSELPSDLSNYPIVININHQNLQIINNIVKEIISHHEVYNSQLFFKLDTELDKKMIIRTIQDLGVINPIIIERLDDANVIYYLETYPILDNIQEILSLLSAKSIRIQKELEHEINTNKEKNKRIYDQITSFERSLIELKNIKDSISKSETYYTLDKINESTEEFINKIKNWRKRKVKITNDQEADQVIAEYNQAIQKYFLFYLEKISVIYDNERNQIKKSYHEVNYRTHFNDNFNPNYTNIIDIRSFMINDLSDDFKKCRQLTIVEKKSDLIGLINSFTKKESKEIIETVDNISYLYQDFRDIAIKHSKVIANNILESISNELNAMQDNLRQSYLKHIEKVMIDLNSKKDVLTNQLSDEELNLQKDNDWLEEFRTQLSLIERG